MNESVSHEITLPRRTFDKSLNAVALAAVLLVNYLANALPLGGRTTGAISDAYPSLFTPAGFTFSIWGVIYLLLLGFVIRQAWPASRETPALSRMDRLFRVNCLANMGWILAWHYDLLVLSLGIMLVILWSLVRIVGILREDTQVLSGWSRALIVLPFSVYFGWITVATIANISVLQSAYGLNDFLVGETTWTLVKLGVAGVCAVVLGWRRNDAAYPFVIAWAAFGIAAAQPELPWVRVPALVVAGFATALGMWAGVARTRA